MEDGLEAALLGLRFYGRSISRRAGGVEDACGDMLDAVLVAGNDAAADLAVEDVLALVVGLGRMGIELLDQALRNRAFLAQPDRRSDDEDVGGSPRYRCAIGLNAGPDTEFGDNIEQINLAHGARTVDAVDGSWPIVGVPQTVVATLIDDDMMSEADIEFQQLRGFDQLVNSVQGVYPDPDNQWSSKGYQRAFKAALITGDGRGRDLGINFPVVPYGEQAARLAMIYLSENRYEATAEVVVSPEWRNLKPKSWGFGGEKASAAARVSCD